MASLDYPVTRTTDQVDDYHGTVVADPYRWLEDTDDPAVSAWIAEQNAVTRDWLARVPAREQVRARLGELWDHPRRGAPWRRGDRWFQMRNTGLQNQDVLWTMDAPPTPDADFDAGRVLLDPNELSPDGTVALTGAAFTDDGALLAYATSEAGSDWMTWRVRDVGTGRDRGDVVRWSKFSGAAWLPDGSGFFYARYDEPRPGEAHEGRNTHQQLFLHRLGTDQSDDVMVYARPDQPEWGFSPTVTEDGRYLVLHVWHGTDRRNRVFYADLEGAGRGGPAQGDVRELLAEGDAGYDFVGNEGPVFFFVTDLDAPRGRIVAVDVRRPARGDWREIVAEGDDTLEHARIVGGRLLAVFLHHARHRLHRYELDGADAGAVDLPGVGSIGALTGRRADAAAYVTLTAFTHPPAVHRVDVATGATAPAVAPGLDVDPERFVTEQAFVTSRDGTRVPVFCVHRRDVTPGNGPHPTVLWGYGGFNIPVTPMFRVAWLVWLEAGGVLAVANLRGGGEYGQSWHDAGRLANKQNVFDDAIAAAEWLTGAGWTSPERLAIQGGSNGGLLVGACLTQRPELFGAAVSEVGVLDMLRFHVFTIGWAWASDYGSAEDPDQFKTLLAYSPLHNVREGVAYPPTLIVTGDHDDRVVPGHSLKFAAALQANQAGDAPILLRVETDTGHGAGKPTAKVIEERADVLAFLRQALGADVA